MKDQIYQDSLEESQNDRLPKSDELRLRLNQYIPDTPNILDGIISKVNLIDINPKFAISKLLLTVEERRKEYLDSIACNVCINDYLKGRDDKISMTHMFDIDPQMIISMTGCSHFRDDASIATIKAQMQVERDAYKILMTYQQSNANDIIEKYNKDNNLLSLATSLLQLKETYFIPHSQNLSSILPLIDRHVTQISSSIKMRLTKEIVDLILPNEFHKNLYNSQCELLNLIWHPGKLSTQDIERLYDCFSSKEEQYSHIVTKVLDNLLDIEALYQYIIDKIELWHEIKIDSQCNESDLISYWGKYTLIQTNRNIASLGTMIDCSEEKNKGSKFRHVEVDFLKQLDIIQAIIFEESNKQKLWQLDADSSGQLVYLIQSTKNHNIIQLFKHKIPELSITEENTDNTELTRVLSCDLCTIEKLANRYMDVNFVINHDRLTLRTADEDTVVIAGWHPEWHAHHDIN